MAKPKRTKVFISYSHADRKWLERLKVFLKPVQREFKIEFWDDSNIPKGGIWEDEIKNALASFRAAILLISPDFFASDYIHADELPPILKAAEKKGTVVLPLIIKPSRFSRSPLSKFQSVNDPKRPLSSLDTNDRDEIYDKVAHTIEDLFRKSRQAAKPLKKPPEESSERKVSPTKPKAIPSPKPKKQTPVKVAAAAPVETPEPQFLAEFVTGKRKRLSRSGKHNNFYEIRLFIKDAPPDTKKVVYKLHGIYDEPTRKVLKGNIEFEEHITSYGDFRIDVSITGKKIIKITCWLSSALENFYGEKPRKAIFEAIKYIEEH